MLKRYLLQNRKIAFKYKLLMFNNLQNLLISRVFVSEEKSIRKYSFIFGGRTENSEGKITVC